MTIEYGMDMARYREHPGVSASDLKALQRSPAYARMKSGKTTPAQAWGNAIHCAVLEPDELEKRFALDPEKPGVGGYPAGWRNTNAYKEQAEALRAGGVELLAADELESLREIVRQVDAHEVGSAIRAADGVNEVSVFANDPRFGLVRKCRPDRLLPEQRMIVDVKSAADHRPGPFARACVNFGYHLTAAYYIDTLALARIDVEHYVFLVVNSEAPHEVAAYTLDYDSIEQGRIDYTRALERWSDCCRSGKWPASTGTIDEIRIPNWAIEY